MTEIKVRNYHVDQFGHVNHARYVEFMEEARWRYMEDNESAAESLHRLDLIHVVVNINIAYRKPVLLGGASQIYIVAANKTRITI